MIDMQKRESSERRTTKLVVSTTPRDKMLLKTIAARRDISVAELIHRWVVEHCEREEGGYGA